MNQFNNPTAVASPEAGPFETVTDFFVLELEERLELSAIAANLFKCLEDIPGVPV